MLQRCLHSSYAMILKRSKSDKAEVKTRHFFNCDRYNKYTPTATIWRTSSRSTDCPFRINIGQNEEGE